MITPAPPLDPFDMLDLLSSLVDKSLVTYEEDAQGQGRYRLLETVKQYGRDRLVGSGEADAVHQGHQEFYMIWAEKADAMISSPEQILWLKRMELEHDNMRAALNWSLIEENGAEASLRLSVALGTFWLVRGELSEGRQWLNRALKRDDQDREKLTDPGAKTPENSVALPGPLRRSQSELVSGGRHHCPESIRASLDRCPRGQRRDVGRLGASWAGNVPDGP